ncbi:hypothetical protein VTN31DRAFT_3465 [Thermomyces dupontii]|uniref:uncharacterized protein n=1 Tax=Talaromyces thermophilus TaxID=28565 RepID=UPI003743230D
MASLQEHIRSHLFSKSLFVSPAWITTFVSSLSQGQQRAPPSALAQTALFRLLTSDFTTSLSTLEPSALLPRDISDPHVQERRIPGPVPVQVLDIEDIGVSSWSQVEAIEQLERGETVRGRQIVRNVDVNDAENTRNNTTGRPQEDRESNKSRGPHRLVLQDAGGTKVMALELKPVEGIAIGKLPIGAKMLLKNTVVGRGMVLLTPDTVTLLGGKIDAMDTAWKKNRKENLLRRIEALNQERPGNIENDEIVEIDD